MEEEKSLESKENAKKQTVREVESDETGLRLDRWVRRHFPGVTHGQLQKWLRTGQIRVGGKRVDSAFRLEEGAMIRLPPQMIHDESFTLKKESGARSYPVRDLEKLKKLVLFEDKDVVVLNKPAGLAVQGGTGLKENLDDSLMVFSLDGVTRPKLVHRLDRDTSGVLLIARTAYAAAKLSASFRSHKTQKIYWAVTRSAPQRDKGQIDEPLIKEGQVMRVAVREDEEDQVKSASTLYKVIERVHKKMAFVALWPLTGRTHQLRVHMESLGAPILGDPLYGKEEIPGAELDFQQGTIGEGLHLHARRLIIPHPRKGLIDVSAPLGPDMKKTFKWLGFDEKCDVSFDDMLK